MSNAQLPAKILAGQSLSDAVDISKSGDLCLLWIAANWTAADIGVEVSVGGSLFHPLYTVEGVEMIIKAASINVAGTVAAVNLNPVTYHGVNFIKIRSGTVLVPVPQAQDVDMLLGFKFS